MLTGLRWLALEVKYLDPAVSFYHNHLDLQVSRRTDDEVTMSGGETDIVLRRPSGVPRGGLHTHYAFSIPEDEYDDWWDRLTPEFDLVEHEFGSAKSLYFYDTEGNCVELGQRAAEGSGIQGIFEVVLEVEDLSIAETLYEALGFEVVDRGDQRRRTRLTAGPFDLELWEPHLGLADARGGVHVDIGMIAERPEAVANDVSDQVSAVTFLDTGVRLRDSDGHYLTLQSED